MGMGGMALRSSFTGGSVMVKMISPTTENARPGCHERENDWIISMTIRANSRYVNSWTRMRRMPRKVCTA